MKTVKHRLVLPLQSKGNLGKSIETTARACWLCQRDVDWQGFDLDADNQTLSRLFPDQVRLVPLTGRREDQDELVRVLKKVTARLVTLIDPRAHLDGALKEALHATDYFRLADRQGVGITVMVFPLDDMDVMTNLDELCQFCGDRVEYVIVKNPARAAGTRMFDGSPLEKELTGLGADTITLPVLSEFVKINLARMEAEHERGIPFNEAIAEDGLGMDIMARGMLQHWIGDVFNQYDRIAGKLLPSAEAAKVKPKTVPGLGMPKARRGAKANLTE
ncbi:MAG: ATPase [Verrucomicrobiota bacterium]|jgi:hypothetical protein